MKEKIKYLVLIVLFFVVSMHTDTSAEEIIPSVYRNAAPVITKEGTYDIKIQPPFSWENLPGDTTMYPTFSITAPKSGTYKFTVYGAASENGEECIGDFMFSYILGRTSQSNCYTDIFASTPGYKDLDGEASAVPEDYMLLMLKKGQTVNISVSSTNIDHSVSAVYRFSMSYLKPLNKTAPLKQENLIVADASRKRIQLIWSPDAFARKFEVQWSTSPSFPSGKTKKAYTKTNSTMYIDVQYHHYYISGLTSGKKYYLRVRGINKYKKGPWSKAKKIRVK